MDRTVLGRTGLSVSVMGLGCGGHSRLGLALGSTDAEAEAVVAAALASGVNFIDTAENYRTEEVVGNAVKRFGRDGVVLSTKAGVGWQDRRCTADEMKERVNACLRRLQTDTVDVFHLHGVSEDEYDYAVQELVPALRDLQVDGKIRFLGITEAFGGDPGHRMLSRAVEDSCWDVVMVGFNILNQSARDRILTTTRAKGIGTLCMFAVRRALSQPEALVELVRDLAAKNLIDSAGLNPDDPLDFLTKDGVASGVPNAAYRFCRWEPGIDVVLSGTSRISHLNENVDSLSHGPLPDDIVKRLRAMFARVDTVSGN